MAAKRKDHSPAPAREAAWARHALLFAGMLAAPVLLRAVQVLDSRVSFGAPDLRGLLADLAVAAALTCGLGTLMRVSTWACVGLALLWSVVAYGNYESIRALGSMAALSYVGYVGDTTFLRGSVLAPARPLALAAAALLSTGLVWAAGRRTPGLFRLLPLLGAALLLSAAVLVWPLASGEASWRQTNFLGANLRWALAPGSAPDPAAGARARAPADLSGAPIVELGQRGSNVLLIILEGISTAHLPSLARHHGYEGLPTRMPELERIARSQLSYSTFVAQQRQTNRGEYALLCGDLPKLLTAVPKMSELAGRGPLECLPAALRDAGYETVYLQAAPLPFMFKDQFMAQAGYTRVIGDEYFGAHYGRSHWGVDDRAYFEQVLAEVRALRERSEPWFLTLLNVGTHHPYNAPRYFRGRSTPGSYGWAVEYLDAAFGRFMAELEQLGVFEDTLVVITSDESNGIQTDPDDTTRMLTQGWGLLTIRIPSGEILRVDEPFAQADLPISILDYLGHSEGARFGGRSVFRRYATPRPLFWANTYLKLVAGVDGSGHLHVCPESFAECRVYAVDDGRIFAMQRREVRGDSGFLRDAARRSQATRAGEPGVREFDLVVAREYDLDAAKPMHFIFGGQFLAAPKGTRIDVELDFELQGSGEAYFRHDLVSRGGAKHFKPAPARIRGGERATLHYSYLTDRDLDRIEARMMVGQVRGKNLKMRFDTARLRLIPDDDGPPGLVPRVLRVGPEP